MIAALTASAHPLDPLSPDEIRAAAGIVRSTRDPQGRLAFVSIGLLEPSKEALRSFASGTVVERRAELVLLDREGECAYEAAVSLDEGALVSWRRLDGLQPAMIPDEYELVERLVKADPRFRAALEQRGISDLGLVGVDPIPAGSWGDHGHAGRRLMRALAWVAPHAGGNVYARPIEGVVGLVDLHRAEVLSIEDHGVVPLPPGMGEYRAGHAGAFRDGVRPLEIAQPEGPSFTIEGNLVRWQRWQLRIGFTEREGLVLHTVGYEDRGRLRPILHRASFSEMVVPYGDPSPTRYLHSPFDIGENLVGRLANSLELGCDCLGLIHYFDGVANDSSGEPVVIRNAICLHEEDDGILWKHWDFRTHHTDVRRSRRLVISSISSIGNYDYGFFWRLYQDGTIEVEVKATGILATAACPPGERPEYGQLVAEGLNGMIHQHFFNVRLDFDVDGESNAVYEVHTEAVRAGPDNPFGNAFRPVRRLLSREDESPAVVDPLSARYWLVVNRDSRNALGEPVGWKLQPGENARPFAQPDSALARRAGFAYRHVWVTRYDATERYAAGDYPYQHAGGAGLPAYVARRRSIEDEDVVVWYTFGLHHLPRPEDWPVMPVAKIGFMLKPFGFFDQNPALDVRRRRATRTALEAQMTSLGAIGAAERTVTGRVIVPADPDYDAARAVWNADVDRRPAAIVRCASVADVAAGVRIAAERDLLLAVRGGGHNVAGYGTCDDGLVLDLSALRRVDVDPVARTARAQGGATWADFDTATQAFGLATTGGVVATTGVGGLTLGGGIGWLKRRHGLTCDNLLAVEIVTADGSLVRATEDDHPDLFFAVRGGGGNFGVVTSFELRLHPVDVVIGGYVAHPIDRLADCVRLVADLAAEMPDELTMLLFVMVAEPHAPMPEALWGRPVVLLGACWCGALDEGERVLAPLRSFGPPALDELHTMRYLDLQGAFADAPQALPGYGNYWKAEYLAGVPDAAVDAIVEHVERMTSPYSYVELDPIGGAIARVPDDSTAVGFRQAPFLLQANAVWRPDDPARDRHVAWSRGFWETMAPYSAGATYLNFIGDEGPDRIRASFGPGLYDRLAAVKRAYDPENRFRVNQNIVPAGVAA